MLSNNEFSQSVKNSIKLGKTLNNGGIELSDDLTAFGKSGRIYPSFTP